MAGPLKLILDATPLIHLAKINFFKHLLKLNVELITTNAVKEEVLKGDYPEKKLLQDLFKSTIRIKEPRSILKSPGLHPGEASILSLGRETIVSVVTDDRLASAVALAEGIETLHTSFFVFRALEKKTISKKQAVGLLDALVGSGWRCSPETYALIRRRIEDF